MTSKQAPPASPQGEPRLLRWFSAFELGLGVLFLALMVVTVLWQVLGRYVPVVAWTGAGEIARYSLVGLTFSVLGWLVSKNAHITIEIIDTALHGRALTVVRALASLVLAVICFGLLWESFALIEGGWTRGTAVLRIPFGYLYLVLALGFISGTARALVNVFLAHRPEEKLDYSEAG